MSYSPLFNIKTKDDVTILHCEYATHSFKEHELLDVLDNMVQQGMAVYIKGSKLECYPAVLCVPKATESVKEVLIPIVEGLIEHDNAMNVAHFQLKWTADKENLSQEHEEWRERIDAMEKRIAAGVEALKSFPDDEGFIIEAWGTL